MSIILDGTSGITTPTTDSTAEHVTSVTGFKNRIINGGMVIDQRNAGASVTPTAGQYLVDRWYYQASQTAKFTAQQNAGSVTPPVGFSKYLGATSLSSYSVPTGEAYSINYSIEGLNVADLSWGTASAETVTLSFRVYSSLTGTFGGVLNNSGATRNYTFSYSIPVANTWTTISVTIAGDTTGTWLTTNGIGISLKWSVGAGASLLGTAGVWGATQYYGAAGQVNVVSTNAATFYITGVQLEKGSVATSFDYRPYGTELSLCQRYYFKSESFSSLVFNAVGTYSSYQFKVSMRASPTVTVAYATGSADRDGFYALSGGVTGSSVVATVEL